MEERLYYINNSWLTYEQAHNLGYSLLPQKKVTFYTQENESVVIKKDVSDNTYYDQPNLRWVSDFYELGLYSYVNTIKCYRGESHNIYRGYIEHIADTLISHILYNELITDLNYLYEHNGVTTYKCDNIIVDELGNPLVWYDSHTSNTKKYFDDRDGRHCWVTSIDDVQVTMYDSSTNLQKQIYEDDSNDSFYIDGSFVSRDDFYSHDNYGVIRDNAYLFRDSTLYIAYYDSYSEEYCIPNVTSIWLSREDITALGYAFIEGVADFWLCQTPLHLPWKYSPISGILHFVNTQYSDLTPRIELPEDREELIGTEIILPEITGVYTDSSLIIWQPTRWDIGEFNSVFVLNKDTTADIECAKVKVTLRFANPYYSGLTPEIHLPEPRTVDNGDLVTLPIIDGEYIDQDNVKWYPQRWSIGEFGSSLVLRNDVTANIICDREKVTLFFVNSRPEFNIVLPEPMIRYYGDDILLPSLSGLYRDEDGYGFRPLAYDIGEFGTLYRTYADTTATLIWEQIVEMRDNALCGSMPGEDIKLVSDGIMVYSPLHVEDKVLLYNPEVDNSTLVLGGRTKKWNSSYEDHYIVFPEKPDTEPSGQFVGGTIRIRGNLANRNTYFSDFPSDVVDGIITYTPIPAASKSLLYNPEVDNSTLVLGGRTKKWDSSYEDHYIVFPEKDVEEHYVQAVTGTIRIRGNLANRFVAFEDITLSGVITYNPLPIVSKELLYNPEEDSLMLLGGRIKKHEPTWQYPPAPVFPEKDEHEPSGQFIGGTIRVKGSLANREIPIDGLFGGLFTT